MPVISMRVLKGLFHEAILIPMKLYILPDSTNLDLLLLYSSPLEVIELAKSNTKFAQVLYSYINIILLVQRYANWIIDFYKSLLATIAL